MGATLVHRLAHTTDEPGGDHARGAVAQHLFDRRDAPDAAADLNRQAGLRGQRADDRCVRAAPGRRDVVLVHGLAGHGNKTWNTFAPRIYSNSQLDADVGVFNYRSGWRRRPLNSPELGLVVEELVSELTKLPHVRIHLVGHSMGGLVAQEAYARYPEKIAALALTAIAFTGGGPMRHLPCLASAMSSRHQRRPGGTSVKLLRFSRVAVGLVAGSALQEHIDHHARKAGKLISYRVRLASLDAVCRMVGLGIGVGVVPKATASRCARSARIKQVALTDAWANRDLVLCTRTTDGLPAYVQQMMHHILRGTPTRYAAGTIALP